MERTITGTVGEVKGKQTAKGVVFETTIGTQKVATWKEPIAKEYKELEGSDVEAPVLVQQKGDYTNYLLNGSPTLVGSAKTSTSTIPVAPSTATNGMPPEREAKIVRQSSMATAFNYAASAGLSEDEAFALAGRIYARAMGQTLDEAIQEVGLEAAVEPATVSDGIPW